MRHGGCFVVNPEDICGRADDDKTKYESQDCEAETTRLNPATFANVAVDWR